MTSTYLKAIILAVLLTLLNACEEDTVRTSNCDTLTILSSDKYENGSSDSFSIISAAITADCLEIKYSASGCDGNSWSEELVDAEAIQESFPIQRNLKMLLDNQEACAAVFTKTVSFDLTPIQTEGYNKIILNIDGFEDPLLYTYGNDTSVEAQIQQKWNLININGGLLGTDTNFPAGSITWEFADGTVTIVNNNPLMGPMYDGFETGTYDYSIGDLNGYETLIVNEQDLGILEIQNQELTVDQRAVDGFQIKFTQSTGKK